MNNACTCASYATSIAVASGLLSALGMMRTRFGVRPTSMVSCSSSALMLPNRRSRVHRLHLVRDNDRAFGCAFFDVRSIDLETDIGSMRCRCVSVSARRIDNYIRESEGTPYMSTGPRLEIGHSLIVQYLYVAYSLGGPQFRRNIAATCSNERPEHDNRPPMGRAESWI